MTTSSEGHAVIDGPHEGALTRSRESAGRPIGEQFRVGFTIRHPTRGQRTVAAVITDLIQVEGHRYIFAADLYASSRNIRCIVRGARFAYDAHTRQGEVLLPDNFIVSRVHIRRP